MRIKLSRFLTKTLQIELILFIFSVIVFMQNYVWISHLFGVLFILTYLYGSLSKKQFNYKINAYIKCYMGLGVLALFSGFWAVYAEISIHKSIQILYILFNIFILYNAIVQYRLDKYFLIGIILGSFMNYLLIFGLISPPFEVFTQGRAIGTMGNANVLAMLMSIAIFASSVYIFLFKPKGIVLYLLYLNIFFSLYGTLMTASKKGLLFSLVLLIPFVLVNLKTKKQVCKLALFLLLAIVIVKNYIDMSQLDHYFKLVLERFNNFFDATEKNVYFGSTAERLKFIELGLNLFAEKPIIGYGIDNFRVFGGTYAHNNYIEIMVGLGLLGLFALIGMYLSVFNILRKTKDNFLRLNLLIVMLSIVMLDMAMVSYYNKFILFFILLLTTYPILYANAENTGDENED